MEPEVIARPARILPRGVGIVGCGSIGGRYARLLSAQGQKILVHDADPVKAADIARETQACAIRDLDALLDARPALVIVATPPNHHADPAVAAIRRGIATLVEKPLAHNLEAAARIVDAAQAGPAQAFCVCNMRFHPAVGSLRDNLSLIGKPLWVRSHFGHRLSQMRRAGLKVFAADEGAGGGVVLDCIHEFDYLQALFGRLTVHSSTPRRIGPDEISAEDWALVHLRSEGGIETVLELDFLSRQKRRGCEIVGTDGTLIWLSRGRNPEVCRVDLARQTDEIVLLDLPSVDGMLEYQCMLKAVVDAVCDGSGCAAAVSLQTLPQAYSALQAAVTARVGTEPRNFVDVERS